MWTYQQGIGKLSHPSVGAVGFGYSGNGEGKNNPAMQSVKAVGPLPRGRYTIGAPQDRPGHTGPYSLALAPDPANEMFGRSAFYIHGDKIGAAPGMTSLGCIILPRLIRWAVWGSGDHELEVVP